MPPLFQYYQAKYFVTDDWQDIKLDLKSFERSGVLLPKSINPKYITSFALVALGKKYRVKLDVSEINFY